MQVGNFGGSWDANSKKIVESLFVGLSKGVESALRPFLRRLLGGQSSSSEVKMMKPHDDREKEQGFPQLQWAEKVMFLLTTVKMIRSLLVSFTVEIL